MLRGVNGSGGGAPVGGSGTTNTIPRWTGPSTLGDSGLTDDGTTIKASRPTWILNVNGFRVSDGGTTNFARLSQSGAYSILDGLAPSGQVWIRTNAGATLAIAATDTGSVGIGTASPDVFSRGYGRVLGISGASSTALGINAATGNIAYFDMGVNAVRSLAMTTDGATPFVTTIGALPLLLGTNGAERARIDSTGNVGIGTASPTAALDTPASTTTRATLRIRSGVAPTAPNDGDIWFTGATLHIRIAGVTRTFTVV